MVPVARMAAALRRGDWLDRRRGVAYGTILLVCEILTFLFLIAGTHGWIVPLDKPTTTDFASFYAAGALADAGAAQLGYDQAAHYEIEQQVTAPGISYQFFFYPPVFIFLCGALARLPYLAAFIAFEAVTILPCVYVAHRIIGLRGWAIVLPILAFPAVFWTLGLGQNAFLTAALIGGGCLLIDRRPLLAGILFGALCYKPHFGLLIPLALAAGGHWRAFVAAAATVAGLVVCSLLAFGPQTWLAFLATALGSHATFESGRIDLSGIVSPFGGVLLIGGSRVAAYVVQATMTLLAGTLVATVWRRGLSLPLRAAALTAGTLVAIPVILIYDMVLAGIAMAWIVRSWQSSPPLPWERLVIAVLFLLPLFARDLGSAYHIPFGSLAGIALFALVARRARAEMAERRDPAVRLASAGLTAA